MFSLHPGTPAATVIFFFPVKSFLKIQKKKKNEKKKNRVISQTRGTWCPISSSLEEYQKKNPGWMLFTHQHWCRYSLVAKKKTLKGASIIFSHAAQLTTIPATPPPTPTHTHTHTPTHQHTHTPTLHVRVRKKTKNKKNTDMLYLNIQLIFY